MEQLTAIADRRRTGGFSANEMLRHDSDVAACYLCRKYHPLRGNNADQDYADFAFRHPTHSGHVVTRLTPDYLRRAMNRAQARRKLRFDSILNFTHNASVLEAFQGSDQSLDLTSFNSLASSATAGWSSTYIDNSANLYLDYIAALTVAQVNTAPASDKCFYLYAATSLNTTDRPTSGASSGNVVANSSSTAAVLTFPSVSTLVVLFPQYNRMDYPVQNIANQSSLMGVAGAFRGVLGLYVWLPILNFSGMTVAASGNAYKYRGVYNTVA